MTVEKGTVTELQWKNTCYEGCQCETFANGGKNCVIPECIDKFSGYPNECDTQVYVTWVGTDNNDRHLQSDNFRLSAFGDFKLQSYYEAALKLSDQTY